MNDTFHFIAVPLEIDMLKREHFNRWYKLLPYFLSVISYEIPFQVSGFCLHFIDTSERKRYQRQLNLLIHRLSVTLMKRLTDFWFSADLNGF